MRLEAGELGTLGGVNSPQNILTQDDAATVIQPVLNQIASLTYDQAASLAPVNVQSVHVGLVAADLTVYRDSLPSGACKVVVQLSVDHGRFLLFFRHGQSFAEGLEFTRAAEPRRLREDELYEFA